MTVKKTKTSKVVKPSTRKRSLAARLAATTQEYEKRLAEEKSTAKHFADKCDRLERQTTERELRSARALIRIYRTGSAQQIEGARTVYEAAELTFILDDELPF